MSGLQLSGLASGFDWKTFTDSMMQAERAPARRYEAEQAKNDTKSSQLSQLGTKLTSLQSAVSDLASSSLSVGRKVDFGSSSSTWSASVGNSTPVGKYDVDVTVLAKASRLTGNEATTPTVAGKLTINGKDVLIKAGDDIAGIIKKINASTAGVTAIYSPTSKKIVLTNRETGVSPIMVENSVLGQQLGLCSRSKSAVVSTPSLAGVLKINGQSIPVAKDQSISSVVSAINDEKAATGVTAWYNSNDGRMRFSRTPDSITANIADTLSHDLGLDAGVHKMQSVGGVLDESAQATSSYKLVINHIEVNVNLGDTPGAVASSINASAAGVSAEFKNNQMVLTSGPGRETPITIEAGIYDEVSNEFTTNSELLNDFKLKDSTDLEQKTLFSFVLADDFQAGKLTINGNQIDVISSDNAGSIKDKINDQSADTHVIAELAEESGLSLINTLGTSIVCSAAANNVAAPQLLSDLGLMASLDLELPTQELGLKTQYTINGLQFEDNDNVLDEEHGVAGFSLKVDKIGLQQIEVSADVSDIKSKINAFVSKYNDVANFIENSTSYTTVGGKTAAGPLSDNREIQDWLKQIRSTVFRAPKIVNPDSASLIGLASLGLEFGAKSKGASYAAAVPSNNLSLDSDKLDATLSNDASNVISFLNTSKTGMASALLLKLNNFIGDEGDKGSLASKISSYSKANATLDNQIAALDRYLEQRRTQLEAGFMAMESAQSKMTQMQTQLTNAFGQKK